MAFFNLTDIKISRTEPGQFREERPTFNNSKYKNSVLRYPNNIGAMGRGHYMIIHINEQVKTRFTNNVDSSGTLPTILQNQKSNGISNPISQSYSGLATISQDLSASEEGRTFLAGISQLSSLADEKVTALIGNLSDPKNRELAEKLLSGFVGAGQGLAKTMKDVFSLLGSGNGLRTIRRTVDSIALYMPDTLNFTNNQQYSTMEFGASPLAYLSAASAGYSLVKDSKEKSKDFISNLTPFVLGNVLRNKLGGAGAGVFAAGFGAVVNPQLEMIYTSPSFREFRFDFMLYPRSSKEALEVQRILNRLRFHQAPELLKEGTGALGGFFLVPPSEFDIEFYYNGRVNPNIPKISTCVLTSIDTDYAPNGWAAYESLDDVNTASLGGTGMPVGIRLSLNFQETEIMTKDNYGSSYREELRETGIDANYPMGSI